MRTFINSNIHSLVFKMGAMWNAILLVLAIGAMVYFGWYK
jgi:hypothetical protein